MESTVETVVVEHCLHRTNRNLQREKVAHRSFDTPFLYCFLLDFLIFAPHFVFLSCLLGLDVSVESSSRRIFVSARVLYLTAVPYPFVERA